MDEKEAKAKVLARLKKLAGAKPDDLTAADKRFIKNVNAENDNIATINEKCNNCFVDAAILLYNALQPKPKPEAQPDEARQYILKAGVDVYFGSLRINAATITDEKAADILKRGFSPDYFDKMP